MESSRGDALRSARKALRLTQQQVAEKIGVTRAAVGLWENDEPISFTNLKAVCTALGIDLLAATEGKLVTLSFVSEEKPQKMEQFGSKADIVSGGEPNLYSKDYFIKKGIIPVYMMVEKTEFQKEGNVQISEVPLLNAERTDRTPNDNSLYLVAQITKVMEPVFSSGTAFSVSSEGVASVGDYVVINTLFNRAYEPGKRPSGALLLPCYFGILESYSGSSVVLRQLNPEERFAIPLNTVASIHKAWPADPR
ncbi:helix-turn-helix transcriptional regulator [Methylobacterium sp. BTF04]|uniref:helix-turn-helix domain-containing protein n=1 Tax=Methylobacterium sp. BTF04 TaxID=2708300 RepID=UPI0013D3CFB9|nr:helix-turn-helix transcriptional regulator [Methylobacterium sp. BTF04]NEU13560.1 helix-turn-helix transcriptional regulator [Methylobacterium sp. BTF04]